MESKIICIYAPLDGTRQGNRYGFHTVQTTEDGPNLRETIAGFIRQDIGFDLRTDLDMGAPRYDIHLEREFRTFLGNNNATIRPISRILDIPGYHVEILFLGI